MNVAIALGCSAILLLLSNTLAKDSATFDLKTERDLDEAFNQILKRSLDETTARSRRGWFKNVWDTIKKPLITAAVNAVVGKRDFPGHNPLNNNNGGNGWKWGQNSDKWKQWKESGKDKVQVE
ncbi:uncharacterized protein LOC131930885 [Physella acuta]|uniref:uncharacterized protein LOC131930885 n=1 Tax=Physella acuta TaxID=109671 RepID=UPI0027DD4944|nr:uncharacterized protein LOC131930885 [Physella acuta]